MTMHFEYFDDKVEIFGGKGLSLRIPRNISSKGKLLDVYAEKIGGREHPRNWDALTDILRDLSWISEREISIVHRDIPMERDKLACRTYLEIMLFIMDYWEHCSTHKIHIFFPVSKSRAIESLIAEST